MAYRGEDLDLKVPAGRLSGAGPGGSAGATLWVDETVLACCNNAFDLALAYGAAEVRLAHLLHALTRVDAAVRVLEQGGVSAARLRHESAALIVNESPVPLTETRNPPRRSADLEGVLRRAVDVARRRHAPADVEDVIRSLLAGSRADPAVDLLHRLAPAFPPLEEPPAENVLTTDALARLGQIEDVLRGLHAELAGDRKLLSDIVRDLQREVAEQRGEGAHLSSALTSRLTALERQLRAAPEIAQKLQSIEKTVQGGMGEGARTWSAIAQRLDSLETTVRSVDPVTPLASRLEAIEKTVQGGMGEGARTWSAIAQRLDSLETTVRSADPVRPLASRLEAIEQTVQGSMGEGARTWSVIAQRLEELETALRSSDPVAPLASRLEAIEEAVQGGMGEGVRTWSAIVQRLESLEATLRSAEPVAPLVARLEAVEHVLNERAEDSVRNWMALADRVQSLEKLFQAGSTEAIRQWTSLTQGHAEILKSLEGRAPDQILDAAALTERLELIERAVRSGLGDTVRSTSLLAERVGVVERVVGTRNDTQEIMRLDERLRAIESTIDGRARETGGRWMELVERLSSIETRIGSVAEAAERMPALSPPSADEIAKPIISYLQSFAQAAAKREEGQLQVISAIGDRLAALEQAVEASNAAVNATARVYDQNTGALHQGFARLSENQHTLASAIGDWRGDSTTELRRIAGALDRLSAVEARLEDLSAKFTAPEVRSTPTTTMPAAAVDVYTPPEKPSSGRKFGLPLESMAGFKRWLFGTDDVRRANAGADLHWQRMRNDVRSAAERLRKR